MVPPPRHAAVIKRAGTQQPSGRPLRQAIHTNIRPRLLRRRPWASNTSDSSPPHRRMPLRPANASTTPGEHLSAMAPRARLTACLPARADLPASTLEADAQRCPRNSGMPHAPSPCASGSGAAAFTDKTTCRSPCTMRRNAVNPPHPRHRMMSAWPHAAGCSSTHQPASRLPPHGLAPHPRIAHVAAQHALSCIRIMAVVPKGTPRQLPPPRQVIGSTGGPRHSQAHQPAGRGQ